MYGGTDTADGSIRRPSPTETRQSVTSIETGLVQGLITSRSAAGDALKQIQRLRPEARLEGRCGGDQAAGDVRPGPHAVRSGQGEMSPIRTVVARPADLRQSIVEGP